MRMAGNLHIRQWRRRAYQLLERGASDDIAARLVHGFLVALIIVNVGGSVLDTVPGVTPAYDGLFDTIEAASLTVFAGEYLLRLWIAPESPLMFGRSAWLARLAWMRSLPGLIDLMAIVPFIVSQTTTFDLKVVVLLRLVRFFKIARYSPGFQSLLEAVRSERRALAACLVIIMSVVLISAGLMYVVEHDAQPDKFGSIPDAMWWAAATVTTVGYGDVVPVTVIGRIIGALTMVTGLLMLALPAGIVATAFASTISRHNFVVTAAMVARMPVFSGLDATAIIDLLPGIATRTFDPDELIMHRGQIGDWLYLVSDGQVLLERGRHRRRLGPGEAFGAVKLCRQNAKAITRAKLLLLEGSQLRVLLDTYPAILTRMVRLDEGADRPPAERRGHSLPHAPKP